MMTQERKIASIEVRGSLEDETSQPVELDLIVDDNEGIEYGMDIVTMRRYLELCNEQADFEVDPDAPRVFVVNEDHLSVDGVASLLKNAPIKVFEAYLQPLEA